MASDGTPYEGGTVGLAYNADYDFITKAGFGAGLRYACLRMNAQLKSYDSSSRIGQQYDCKIVILRRAGDLLFDRVREKGVVIGTGRHRLCQLLRTHGRPARLRRRLRHTRRAARHPPTLQAPRLGFRDRRLCAALLSEEARCRRL